MRDQNKAAVYGVVAERPGVSVGEIAQVTGIAKPLIHNSTRAGSDCWDVKLVFFFPDRPAQTVRRLYRFTVDVADVVPATVGPMRSWSIR
jgi:hypothetical protein